MSQAIVETADVNYASQIEKTLPPGVYKVKIDTSGPVSPEELTNVYNKLSDAGVIVKAVDMLPTGLQVTYEKPPAGISALPVAIIPLIGLALIVGIVAVAIFNLESITKTVLVVLGGLILLAFVLKQPLTEAARRI